LNKSTSKTKKLQENHFFRAFFRKILYITIIMPFFGSHKSGFLSLLGYKPDEIGLFWGLRNFYCTGNGSLFSKVLLDPPQLNFILHKI